MNLSNLFLILAYTSCVVFSIAISVRSEVVTNDDDTNLSLVHHNYTSMEEYLKKLHDAYPNITRLYSIGKSVEGRELYVMEITSNPGKHDVNKPEVKYIGNIHGNEVTGKETLLHLMKVMCTQYGIEERITNIVNSIRLHILPSMNPDGYERIRQLHDQYPRVLHLTGGRRNINDVDLNRNFPGHDAECMSILNREPETQAIMRWSAEIPFVLALSAHDGYHSVIYPYGYKKEHTPDDAVFQNLALSYLNNHPIMSTINCTNICTNGKVMGAAADYYDNWLILNSMQDYNYMCSNCFTLGIEMNRVKFPEAHKLAGIWQQNKESLLAFVEMSRKGIHGFVYSSTGEPISRAAITIEGNTKPIVTAKDGDYWRLMVPGDYNVTASYSGYEPVTKFVHVPLINESLSGTIILNFTLTPIPVY